MNALARSVVGMALAAGAVYLFDPVSGHRRRLILRDEVSRATRRLDKGTRRTRRDLSVRAQELASRWKADRPTDHRPSARERAERMHVSGSGVSITSGILLATGCGLLAWGIKERKTLRSWGQDLWRTSKRQIDEMVEQAKDVAEEHEPSAVAAAVDEAVDVAGRAQSHRQHDDRTGGGRSHIV